MIKLSRKALSGELAVRIAERAAQLRELTANGENPPAGLLNAYRDPELKAHLVAEAHGKCIYCESKSPSGDFMRDCRVF
jgi:hypothetical protein